MALTSAQLEPLLRLSLVEGVGPHRLARLMARFGRADAAIGAREAELRALPGIGQELAARIRAAAAPLALAQTRQALATLERLGAVALTLDDPSYPKPFLDLPDRPYLLFAAGDVTLLERPAVSIVGTRSPTPYGRATAGELSAELARSGIVIISGMARGIDAAAHLGCLRAGCATIGVLGHGIDQVYPPEARALFAQVRREGLLLTEYPPGETPRAGNFPRRNRLITALSRAVVIVEMGHQSGAQHSVSYALEQGKEVMAVPGPIGSRTSEGTNQLIKDGASIVTCAADILEELFGVGSPGPGLPPGRPHAPLVAGVADPALPLLTAGEDRLLELLDDQPKHVDDVAARATLPASEALVLLLELELRGLVVSTPGMRFSRSRAGYALVG